MDLPAQGPITAGSRIASSLKASIVTAPSSRAREMRTASRIWPGAPSRGSRRRCGEPCTPSRADVDAVDGLGRDSILARKGERGVDGGVGEAAARVRLNACRAPRPTSFPAPRAARGRAGPPGHERLAKPLAVDRHRVLPVNPICASRAAWTPLRRRAARGSGLLMVPKLPTDRPAIDEAIPSVKAHCSRSAQEPGGRGREPSDPTGPSRAS